MDMKDERENRALEALIVLRLRSSSGDDAFPDELPQFTESERASMNCFKPGFIEQLIARADDAETTEFDDSNETNEVCEERELVHGMNRAEEVDEEANEELDRQRQELLRRIQEDGDGQRDRSDR